jgi:enhancing lycopene biosynthesis protein 2
MPHIVAVILSGSGRADGSEVTEAVSILIHLSRHNIPCRCFAPDAPQTDVINHATGKPAPGGQTRNMLVEAARICRDGVTPLSKLEPTDFGGLVFAGGFGAAKNLSTFALPGEKSGAACDVLPDVARVIKAFHAAKKPIGLCCIAPVLAARVLGTRMNGPGIKVTIGADRDTAAAIATMGSINVPKGVTESYTDEANRIITTPAYMYDAKPIEVYEGIGKMIDGVAALLQ